MGNKNTSKEIIAKTIKANLFMKINKLIQEAETELKAIDNNEIFNNK